MDNTSIHHTAEVTEITVLTLNPIEEVFAKIKSYLKANDVTYRTTSILRLILASAINSITTDDCFSYVKPAGYNVYL